jgi:hypothetical protein
MIVKNKFTAGLLILREPSRNFEIPFSKSGAEPDLMASKT